MRMSRAGALMMLVIVALWAATPTIACLVPMHQMTEAEHDCCLKMAQECGSSMIPSSHSCCQGHQRDTAGGPVATYSPTRPFDVAIVPWISILLVSSPSVSLHLPALEAPPPVSSPGCGSILRI
jgi:hypothetical protein